MSNRRRRICVVTSSRADYGLLKPLLIKLAADKFFSLKIIATGTHLSNDHGFTINEIKEDGFNIDFEVDILLAEDSPAGISKSMGLANIGFAEAFKKIEPDILLILGDRFEILCAAQVALIFNIPIAHIHGGEGTEGAIDDSIRHAISKMSAIHYVAAKEYARRVIQLGEEPKKVFDVGALGVENALNSEKFSKSEISKILDIEFTKPILLVTFHPETIGIEENGKLFDEVLKSLSIFKSMQIIFTYPNADLQSSSILRRLEGFVEKNENCHAFKSLGQKMYLSLMSLSNAVVGNSSSGIIEAPAMKTPTVNIGNRQTGRLFAKSIVSTSCISEDITRAIKKVNSKSFQKDTMSVDSRYGMGKTSSEILKSLRDVKLTVRKKFYDIP